MWLVLGTTSVVLSKVASWAGLVTAVTLLLATVTNTVMQIIARMDAKKLERNLRLEARRTARRVQRVATVLHDTTEKQEVSAAKQEVAQAETKQQLTGAIKTLDVVHKLVNNDMHLALKSNRDLATRIAKDSGSEADKAVADEAERKLQWHDAQQIKADVAAKSSPEEKG